MARRGDGIYRRGRIWYFDALINGTRHVEKIGKDISRTVAAEIAGVKRAAILRGEAGIGRKRKDISFDQAKEAFIAWAATTLKPRTVKSYTECVKRLSKSALFAGKRLGQITTWTLERYKQERAPKARVRVNRELAVMKAIFNRMQEWKKYDGPNPVKAVAYLKEPHTRLRYLEAEEESALLAAAREPLRSVILVGIHAGLRIQAEAIALRWQDVDLKRGFLTVQAAYAKNGTCRSVPLNSVLREALTNLKKTATGENVFMARGGKPLRSIRDALETACSKAKVDGVTPHTLRHTFASRLAMAGVDLRTIQDLGGWKTLALVQRYSHLSASHRAEAVERIAGKFPNAIHNTEACDEKPTAISS